MSTDPTPIDPQDYFDAVDSLNELLAFWLLVNRNAPDRGMGHRFVQEAVSVLQRAETRYGRSHYLPTLPPAPEENIS